MLKREIKIQPCLNPFNNEVGHKCVLLLWIHIVPFFKSTVPNLFQKFLIFVWRHVVELKQNVFATWSSRKIWCCRTLSKRESSYAPHQFFIRFLNTLHLRNYKYVVYLLWNKLANYLPQFLLWKGFFKVGCHDKEWLRWFWRLYDVRFDRK